METVRTKNKINMRKILLAEFIEMLVLEGYCIQDYIYKPLSNYNYKGIASQIVKMKKVEGTKYEDRLKREGEVAS